MLLVFIYLFIYLPSVRCEYIWNPWLYQLKCTQLLSIFFFSNYHFNLLLLSSHTSSSLADCLYFSKELLTIAYPALCTLPCSSFQKLLSLVLSLAAIVQEWVWITAFPTVTDKLPHGAMICYIKRFFLLLRRPCSALASGTDSNDYNEIWYKHIISGNWYFIQWHHQTTYEAAYWVLTETCPSGSIWKNAIFKEIMGSILGTMHQWKI